MITKELYCFEREEGKVTVSTEKPDCDFTLRYRLIAEEGKALTKDGENFTSCVDVESIDGWYETATRVAGINVASEVDYITALESLGVNFNE